MSRRRRLFGIDVRTLALFRIAIALVLLCDLGVRSVDLVAHYTDVGVLPRALLAARDTFPFEQVMGWGGLSLHTLSGSAWFEALLFAVAAIAAVMLLIGKKTRLMTLLSWLLLTSLHIRNPLVLYGGDHLLRLLLFWSIFLPLGATCSFDARGRSAPQNNCVLSMASLAILLQVAMLYLFAALWKSGSSWHGEGTALYYAFSADLYAKPLAVRLLAHPRLLSGMTHAVFWFEMLVPLLLFLPVRSYAPRYLAIALLWTFDLALFLTLEVGIFPWVSAAAVILFLPPTIWERARWSTTRTFTVPRSASWAVGAALVWVVTWNVTGLPGVSFRMPEPLRSAGLLLRLDQRWNLFAPDPLTDDGWFVVPVFLADGGVRDALAGGASVSWDKPARVSAQFPNHRWRKYFTHFRRAGMDAFQPPLAEYLGHRAAAGAVVKDVDLVFMREVTPLPGEPGSPVRRELLYSTQGLRAGHSRLDRRARLGRIALGGRMNGDAAL